MATSVCDTMSGGVISAAITKISNDHHSSAGLHPLTPSEGPADSESPIPPAVRNTIPKYDQHRQKEGQIVL